MLTNFFFSWFFQIAGSVVLSIGIWIAADKSSFIQVTKIVESTSVVDGRVSSQYEKGFMCKEWTDEFEFEFSLIRSKPVIRGPEILNNLRHGRRWPLLP